MSLARVEILTQKQLYKHSYEARYHLTSTVSISYARDSRNNGFNGWVSKCLRLGEVQRSGDKAHSFGNCFNKRD